MNEQQKLLLKPGFIIGLLVLIINDHLLKQLYPGFITGKLSDVAGLFIFPIFFLALGITRKKLLYVITGIGFVWWKSPLSEPFIQFFNGISSFEIQRVIDYSDLFALLILPLSYAYLNAEYKTHWRLSPLMVIIASSFAFISTSQAPKRIAYRKTFSFQYPIDTLKQKIFFNPGIWNYNREKWLEFDSLARITDSNHIQMYVFRKDSVFNAFFTDTMVVSVEDIDRHYLSACIVPLKNRQLSVLNVLYLQHAYFDKPKAFEDSLIVIFENKFIKPLYE